jgi:hypothetical protein
VRAPAPQQDTLCIAEGELLCSLQIKNRLRQTPTAGTTTAAEIITYVPACADEASAT